MPRHAILRKPDWTPAMPAARSPAQIEASRRNGARSRGPVTEEGKARASATPSSTASPPCTIWSSRTRRPSELEELTARLMAEVAPMSEIEARFARRLAIAFWKGERAERIEVALFNAAPRLRPPQAGYEWEQADPLDHLRPQALQRRAQLPGAAGQGAVALPQGAAQLAQGGACGRHGRTRGHVPRRTRGPPAPANDDGSVARALRGRETR